MQPPRRRSTRLSDIVGPEGAQRFVEESKRLNQAAAVLRSAARRGLGSVASQQLLAERGLLLPAQVPENASRQK